MKTTSKMEETLKNKVKMKIGDEDDKRVWLKLQLLYLIQSSTNPPSIQRKINAVDIAFS